MNHPSSPHPLDCVLYAILGVRSPNGYEKFCVSWELFNKKTNARGNENRFNQNVIKL